MSMRAIGLGIAIALLQVLVTVLPSVAANHYVRDGASGAGTSWTDACDDFAGSCAVSSLVRGDTYYVATGTYAARTFNTAVNGTLVITIKGATAADHGTDEAGWNSAYGVDVAQAHWAYQLVIDSSYWVFDGSVPTTPLNSSSSAYGFLVDKPSPCSTSVNGQMRVALPGTLSNVTVKHLAIVGCGSAFDVGQKLFIVGGSTSFASSITLSTIYLGDGSGNLQFGNVTNSLVEYLYSDGNWTSVANHGTSFNISCSSDDTIRYSYWLSGRGTATFDVLDQGCNPSMDNFDVYGNLFTDKSDGGNGVISIGDGTTSIANSRFYNNTDVDSTGTWFRQCETGSPSGCPQAVGNVLKNNLIYNSNGGVVRESGLGGGAIDNDYNSYLSGTNPMTETNGQIASFDPFVNAAGGNYHLSTSGASSLNAGLTLSSPYTTDIDGIARGSGGKWDRGAYELGQIRGPAAAGGLRFTGGVRF
jgi:hypothetical protein